MCLRRHTRACDFVLPSDTFFAKYRRAASFPVGETCESAIRGNAQFNFRLPLFVFRYRVVFPDEHSRGAHPAYFARDGGERNRLMSPITSKMVDDKTVAHPEAVGSVSRCSFMTACTSRSNS